MRGYIGKLVLAVAFAAVCLQSDGCKSTNGMPNGSEKGDQQPLKLVSQPTGLIAGLTADLVHDERLSSQESFLTVQLASSISDLFLIEVFPVNSVGGSPPIQSGMAGHALGVAPGSYEVRVVGRPFSFVRLEGSFVVNLPAGKGLVVRPKTGRGIAQLVCVSEPASEQTVGLQMRVLDSEVDSKNDGGWSEWLPISGPTPVPSGRLRFQVRRSKGVVLAQGDLVLEPNQTREVVLVQPEVSRLVEVKTNIPGLGAVPYNPQVSWGCPGTKFVGNGSDSTIWSIRVGQCRLKASLELNSLLKVSHEESVHVRPGKSPQVVTITPKLKAGRVLLKIGDSAKCHSTWQTEEATGELPVNETVWVPEGIWTVHVHCDGRSRTLEGLMVRAGDVLTRRVLLDM